MAVLFMILQGIGKVLLVLLVILLVLILLLLFWPFCYRGTLTKHGDEIRAEGSIWWLMHAVHASGYFHRTDGTSKKDGEVRVFGIPLIRLIRRHRSKTNTNEKTSSGSNGKAAGAGDASARPEGRREDGSAKKKPTVEPGRWKYMPKDDTVGGSMKAGVYQKKEPSLLDRLTARLAAFIGKVKKKLAALAEKIKKIGEWLDYLGSEGFDRLKDLLIREIRAILHHVLPRKISGYVDFSTGDPASTGEALGAVAAFYTMLPKGLEVRPDFENKKLEADVSGSGHIFLIVLLIHGLKVLLNKDFKELRKRLKAEKQNKPDASADTEKTESGNGRHLHRRKKEAGEAA